MLRVVGALLLVGFAAPAALAITVSGSVPLLNGADSRIDAAGWARMTSRPANEFTIGVCTEVRLDGRPCPYAKVPRDAEILLLQFGSNPREVVKIHFRSKPNNPTNNAR